MAKETKLQIVIDAKNNTTAGFSALKKQLDITGVSVEGLSSAMKSVGKVGTVALAGLVGFIGSSVKSYGEAQTAIAKVDATLKAMEKSTTVLVVGTKNVAGALKLTGTEAAEAQNKIAALNLKIRDSEMALKEVKKAYRDDKVSKKEMQLRTDQLNNSIEASRLAINKYKTALSETDTKTVNITKSIVGISGSFEEVKKKILDASAAVVRLGFDDEAAAVSITNLYQRTGDLTEAIKLNALAMDLARHKNIDLESASRMVSLVLSGNARALKEYGIELDETKTPMEAIAELQGKVGGQAEEATKSITVQGQVFAETFSNLKDTIGKQFIPVLTSTLQAITPLIERLGAWIEKNPELTQTILMVTLAIAGVMAVMLPLGMALPGLVMGFQALAVVFGLVTLATAPWLIAGAAVIALFVYLVKQGYITQEGLTAVWKGIGEVIRMTANGIIMIVEGMINFIVGQVNMVIKLINSVVAAAKKAGIGKDMKKISLIEDVSINKFQEKPDLQSMMPAAGAQSKLPTQTVINVTGNTFLDQYGAQQVGDLLMSKLKLSNQV